MFTASEDHELTLEYIGRNLFIVKEENHGSIATPPNRLLYINYMVEGSTVVFKSQKKA